MSATQQLNIKLYRREESVTECDEGFELVDGTCQEVDGPKTECKDGQELIDNVCKEKCKDNEKRDESGVCKEISDIPETSGDSDAGSANTGFFTSSDITSSTDIPSSSLFLPIAFLSIAILLIFSFFLQKLIKKFRKNKTAYYNLKKTKYKKFQYASLSLASLSLVIGALSFSFADYIHETDLDISATASVTVDAGILDTDEIAVSKATLNLPANNGDIKLYISSAATDLVDVKNPTNTIPTITTKGKLTDNSYGVYIGETAPTADSEFYPISILGTNETSIFTTNSNQSQTITIWYGVRAKNKEASTYTSSLTINARAEQDIVYLQEVTPEICQELEIGVMDLYRFKDSRDEKEYGVARMKDGNCWMTENMRLDPGTELDSSNSDLDEGMTFIVPESTSGDDFDDGSEHFPRMHIENIDDRDYYYYNWTSAIAREDSSSITELNEIATTSICPRGWHMPTGGQDDKNEFIKLLLSYADNSRGLGFYVPALQSGEHPFFPYVGDYAIDEVVKYAKGGEYWSSTNRNRETVYGIYLADQSGEEGWIYLPVDFDRIFGEPVRCLLDIDKTTIKYHANLNTTVTNLPETETLIAENHIINAKVSPKSPRAEGYIFSGWATDPDGELVYRPGEEIAIAAATYDFYAIWLRSVTDGQGNPIETMQDFTDIVCLNLEEGVEYGLRDSRDNKVYKVSKFKDGNCWMQEGLALDLASPSSFEDPNGGARRINEETGEEEIVTLDSSNTDVDSVFQPQASTVAYPEFMRNIETSSIKNGQDYYYDWYSTTATTSTIGAGDVSTSICPKGWDLPTDIDLDNFLTSNSIEYLRKSYSSFYLTQEEAIYNMMLISLPNYDTSGILIYGLEDGIIYGHILNGPEFRGFGATKISCMKKATPHEGAVAKAIIAQDSNEGSYELIFLKDETTYRTGDDLGGKTIVRPFNFYNNIYFNEGTQLWYSYRGDISTVTFKPSFRDYHPVSTAYWFEHLNALTTINNLENLNTDNTLYMQSMFSHAGSITHIDFPEGFGRAAIRMRGMFESASSLVSLTLPDYFGENAQDMGTMFDHATSLSGLSLPQNFGEKASNMSLMFCDTHSLVSIDFNPTFGRDAEDMSYMFSYSAIKNLDNLPNGFGNQATNVKGIFYPMPSLESLVLPSGFASKASEVKNIFHNDGEYATPPELVSVEIGSGFGNSATDMSGLFSGFSSLESVIIHDGVGENITDMSQMFSSYNLSNVSLPDNFGKNAINMSQMFDGTKLSSIILPEHFGDNAENIEYIFSDSKKLARIYVSSGTDWAANGKIQNSIGAFSITSLPGYVRESYSNHTDIANAHIGIKNGIQGHFTDKCVLDHSCPEGYDPNDIDAVPVVQVIYDSARENAHVVYNSEYYDRYYDDNGDDKNDEFSSYLGNTITIGDTYIGLSNLGGDDGTTKAVTFEPSFQNYKPTSLNGLFKEKSNLEEIFGLEYLDISGVTDTTEMFYDNYKLEHIYVPANTDWNNGRIIESTDMFASAYKLPNYTSGLNRNITRAHIGDKNGVLGYFTDNCVLHDRYPDIYAACPEGYDSNNGTSTSSTNSAESTSSSQTAIHSTTNNTYTYTNPDSEPEERPSEEEPETTKPKAKEENEPTEPLGVARNTKEESSDSATIIVIAISTLLVVLGGTIIIVIEKRNKEEF